MVNLEHIKVIITAEEVFIFNPFDPIVHSFVSQLQQTLGSPPTLPLSKNTSFLHPPHQEPDQAIPNADLALPEPEHAAPSSSGPAPDVHGQFGSVIIATGAIVEDLELLPFEFRVVEMILENVLSRLDRESKELQAVAKPALDDLTRSVSSQNLERVRLLKNRLTLLTSRVQKVRNELEQLLDDDQDMADLYLTRRLQWLRLPDLPDDSPQARDGRDGEGSIEKSTSVASFGQATRTFTTVSSDIVGKDVEDLEMLLEAYFMQVDGILNKLTTLHEYVDDTEDYVNIQLDHHRNQLQGMQVILTALGVVLSIAIALLGAFAMNVPNVLYKVSGYGAFYIFLILSFGLALVALVAFSIHARRKKLTSM